MNILSKFAESLATTSFSPSLSNLPPLDFNDSGLVLGLANLGKAVASMDFGEASLIEDAEVKSQVQALLQQKAGRIKAINWLLFNPGIVEIGQKGEDWEFRGQAEQAISSVRSQYYNFRINGKTGQIVYKLTNPQAAADVADFEETYEFATSSKKLNCKPGNIQCGGKCQSGKLNCYANLDPKERKAAQAAARKASALAKKTTVKPQPGKTKTKKTITKPDLPDVTKPSPKPATDKPYFRVNSGDYKALIELGKSFTEKNLGKLSEPSKEEQSLLAKKQKLFLRVSARLAEGKQPTQGMKNDILQIDYQYNKLLREREKKETESRFQPFKNEIIKYHGISEEKAKEVVGKIALGNLSPTEKENSVKAIQEFYQLTGLKGSKNLKELSYTDPRAHANESRGFINIGDGRKSTLFHEAGHHAEFVSKKVAGAARDWVENRATSKIPEKLQDLTKDKSYRDDEIALPDKFINPYVGKIYGDRGSSTEVLSMGVERFSSPVQMRQFYKEDPEHFHLTVGILLSGIDRRNLDPSRVKDYHSKRQKQDKQIERTPNKKVLDILKKIPKGKNHLGEETLTLDAVRAEFKKNGISSRRVQDELLYRLDGKGIDLNPTVNYPEGKTSRQIGAGIPANFDNNNSGDRRLYYVSLTD